MTRPSSHKPALAAAVLIIIACASGVRPPVPTASSSGEPRSTVGQSLSVADSVFVARVDAFTRGRVAVDSLSGVVLLAHDGVPIYQLTSGLANRTTRALNNLDTKFNLGSVDKYFTRIAIWQLSQNGKLSTSDTVGKILPEYPNQQVRSKVTIGQLLAMRSGIGDFDNDNYRTYRAALPRLRSIDDYLSLFAKDSLHFPPGTKTEYSNGGYVVLGKIIERLSGESYFDYVQRHIFDAAGMKNTGYFVRGADVPNLAIGYTSDAIVIGDTTTNAPPLKERRPNTDLVPYRGSSAGGGYSSAEDLLKLSRALFEHRLLSTAFTDSLMRFRNTGPGKFDWDGWLGGAEGINALFLLSSTGHTLIVLSNYDPPSANVYRPKLWGEWLPEWLRNSTAH